MLSIIILVFIIQAINSQDYQYQKSDSFQITTNTTPGNYFRNFYLSSNQTYILEFYYNIKMFDRYESRVLLDFIPNRQMLFGEQISLIDYGSREDINFIKSYQYPDKRLSDVTFNQSTMNSVTWIDNQIALIAANVDQQPCFGIYTANQDIIIFKRIGFASYKMNFTGILKLYGTYSILVTDLYAYAYNRNNSNYQVLATLQSKSLDKKCIKTYETFDNKTNIITEYILISTGVTTNLKRRYIYVSNQTQTYFSDILAFKDISYDCAFNFVDQHQMFIINQSSYMIFRSLDIDDIYIRNSTNKIDQNSTQIYGRDFQFVINGTLKRLSSDLSTYVKDTNITGMVNERKVWITTNNKTISFDSNKTVGIKHGSQSFSKLTNILDCQFINNRLFILNSTLSYIKFELYDYNNQSQVASFSLQSYSYLQLRLQSVKLANQTYCLLVIQKNNQKVFYQIWDYNNGFKNLYNYTMPSFYNAQIPSQKSYFLTENDEKTLISFYSVQGNKSPTSINVREYKWLKVLDTIFVIYIEATQQCYVYNFNIDFDTNTVNILNVNNPTKIKLDKMSSNVTENQFFLLKDPRTNPKPNNFIIYFYDDTRSYSYNTLDPIIRTTKIKQYAFTPQTLLVNPQLIQLNFYYILSNFSFVHIEYLQTSSIYQSCNFQQIFKFCKTLEMSILDKNQTNIISFLCSTEQHDIIALYDPLTIMKCNIDNRIKMMIYEKGVKDYDINLNGDMIVIDKSDNDSLDFYRSTQQDTIPIPPNIICQSKNGYYFAYYTYEETKQIFTYDLLRKTNNSIPVNVSYDLCAIDNSGSWYIAYQAGLSHLQIYKNNVFFRQIYFKDGISQVRFVGSRLMIVTSNALLYYENFITAKPIYLLRNDSSLGRIESNDKYVAFITKDKDEWRSTMNVCELGRDCFKTYIPYSKPLFRLDGEGKVYILNDNYDYNNNVFTFHEWSLQKIGIDNEDCSNLGIVLGLGIPLGILTLTIIIFLIIRCTKKREVKKSNDSSLSKSLNTKDYSSAQDEQNTQHQVMIKQKGSSISNSSKRSNRSITG